MFLCINATMFYGLGVKAKEINTTEIQCSQFNCTPENNIKKKCSTRGSNVFDG